MQNNNKVLPYNKADLDDTKKYAEGLVGKTFREILENNFQGKELDQRIKAYNTGRNKGGFGNLLEEFYFYYKPNSDSRPDFVDVGVELKVVPYEITKNNKLRSGERLVIGMIPNREPAETDFYKSGLFQKIKLMLIIFYLRNPLDERVDYKINHVYFLYYQKSVVKT